jgi:hypothetical protein
MTESCSTLPPPHPRRDEVFFSAGLVRNETHERTLPYTLGAPLHRPARREFCCRTPLAGHGLSPLSRSASCFLSLVFRFAAPACIDFLFRNMFRFEIFEHFQKMFRFFFWKFEHFPIWTYFKFKQFLKFQFYLYFLKNRCKIWTFLTFERFSYLNVSQNWTIFKFEYFLNILIWTNFKVNIFCLNFF